MEVVGELHGGDLPIKSRHGAAPVVQMDWFLWKINVKTVVPKERSPWVGDVGVGRFGGEPPQQLCCFLVDDSGIDVLF